MINAWRKANWVLSQQVGVDLRKLAYSPVGLWRYLRDLSAFRRTYSGALQLMPCLHDRRDQAGSASGEYFWQDLIVARMVFEMAPKRHVDIGSRVDGFVAHIASFRDIEVFDVRPLEIMIPGVKFRQVDLMSADVASFGTTDSLSCLHALEHFGLGRYGDPLDVNGFERGLDSLTKLIEPNGRLYLSCPSGDDVVYFNAHRAMRPATVVRLAAARGLLLEDLRLFDDRIRQFSPAVDWSSLPHLAMSEHHTLALYRFKKTGDI